MPKYDNKTPSFTGKGAVYRMDAWLKKQPVGKLRAILTNKEYSSSFKDDVRKEIYRRGSRVKPRRKTQYW